MALQSKRIPAIVSLVASMSLEFVRKASELSEEAAPWQSMRVPIPSKLNKLHRSH